MPEEAKRPPREIPEVKIPWVVAYLREDIQDLRNEVRENRRSIESLRREMGVQFRWMIGTMVAVGGLIVAALKLLL